MHSRALTRFGGAAVQVDQRHEAILVPIYGVMVPFHILTLKNATVNQDGSVAFVRLNFNFGGPLSAGLSTFHLPCMYLPHFTNVLHLTACVPFSSCQRLFASIAKWVCPSLSGILIAAA